MIKNTQMSQANIKKQAQRGNRYENIHKNFVLPQQNYYGQSSYQNSYPIKQIDYNDLRAVIQKPKSTIQNRQFEGVSAYNEAYIHSKNFNGKPQKFRQPDNIQLSSQPFNGSSQYTAQLRGQPQSSKTQRYSVPQNQIFPKGQFEGASNYNNSYVTNQMTRQPQFRPQGQIKIGQDRFEGKSSYLNDFSPNKDVRRTEKITQKNNQILPRGNFSGESTYLNAYVPSTSQRIEKFVPQSQLKIGGKFQGQSSYEKQYNHKMIQKTERFVMPQNQTLPKGRFQGQSNYNDSYIGTSAEKAKQFRPEQQWKMNGQFQGNSSYLNDYQRYQNAKKSSMIPLQNNKFMPEGQFQSGTSYQDSYMPNPPTRERPYHPQGELRVGGQNFQGNSSYLKDFPTRGQMPVAQKFRPKQNDILPKGRFEGQSSYNQNYIPSAAEKNQSYKPRGQLEVGGKFEGTSNYTQQFHQKKGLRAERVPLPTNQVMPQGRFDGQSNYTNSYIPTAVQRTQKFIMKPELQVGEGRFQGNSTYAQNYQNFQYSPIKQGNLNDQYPEQNRQPRWNKKTSRWE